MDNARVYKQSTKQNKYEPQIYETRITAVISLLADVFGYFSYFIGYSLHTLKNTCKSETMKRVLSFYIKYLSVWVSTLAIYLFIGIVGGLEAGLISFAVGIPCCAILLICGAVLTKER